MAKLNKTKTARVKSITKIRNTALLLFAQKGYLNTSLSSIAQKAGISKGLIYNYFTSKDELLKEVLMGSLNEIFSPESAEEIFKLKTPHEKIKKIILLTYEIAITKPDFLKLYMSIMFQPNILDSLKSELNVFFQEWLKLIESIFSDMEFSNVENEAKIFIGLLDGVQLHYISLENHYPLKDILNSISQKYINENSII